MKNDKITTLEISLIDPSKTNRKNFDDGLLSELAKSIQEKGVLIPVLVRPHPQKKGRYELVAGERRWRASKLVEKTDIPAIIKEMSDIQALEAQIIENLQRENLQPMEEAEGFALILKKGEMTVKDLASKIGKSLTYIYQRTALLALPDIVKKALTENIINPQTALLVARIPNRKLAEQAGKEVVKGWGRGQPMSYKEALEHVYRNYMLSLREAPFDVNDDKLIPLAGICATCPKRAGNQKELFPDVQKADLCTDPVCFQQKQEASWQKLVLTAKAEEKRILEPQENKAVFQSYSSGLLYDAPFVLLNDRCPYDDKGRTWKTILGKHVPKSVLGRDSKGNAQDLLPIKEAKKALKLCGVSLTRGNPNTEQERQFKRKAKQAAELAQEINNTVLDGIVEKVKTQKSQDQLWTFLSELALSQFHTHFDTKRRLAIRRGWNRKTDKIEPDRFMNDTAQKLKGSERAALVVEALLLETSIWSKEVTPWMKKASQHFQIDLKKISKDVADKIRKTAKTKVIHKKNEKKVS